MKSITTLPIIIFLFLGSITNVNAQMPNAPDVSEEFIFNPEKKPCLTLEQRSDIIQNLKTRVEELRLENRLLFSEQQKGSHPLFIWPIQKANTVTFNDVWAISNYVDHNAAFPNQLTDYNCGTKTYDSSSGYNHQGLDIYNWPFTWKLMDDDAVEIIAGADGQIIAKNDGEFDRSCNFNNNIWNAVYVQHSDGSVAWYGHMKNGSLTTKNVGDTVSAGEFLGIVGSSGNSTGPHLHFEVYTDNNYTQLVDPYDGACNSMNPADSWWAIQKPYVNPKINAVLTHTQAPTVFPPCPTTETPYISNDFDSSDAISFAFYLRDQTAGDTIILEILRPDNTTLFAGWNITVQSTNSSWYYLWGPWTGYWDMVGEWKWQVTFNGETVTHPFNVTSTLSVEENEITQTSLYPNPFIGMVNISSSTKVVKANVVDILGKSIVSIEEFSNGIKTIDLTNLSNGLYFIELFDAENQTKTIKVLKE